MASQAAAKQQTSRHLEEGVSLGSELATSISGAALSRSDESRAQGFLGSVRHIRGRLSGCTVRKHCVPRSYAIM